MIRKLLDILNLYWLIERWNWHYNYSIVKMILFCAFFLVCDATIFIARWFIYNHAIREVGFPRRNDKYIRKKYKSYSFFEKITLLGIYLDAENRSIYLLLSLIRNIVNLIAAVASVIGFVGSIITHCDGWAFCLFGFSEFGSWAIDVVVFFIPELIWQPSAREMYKFWK